MRDIKFRAWSNAEKRMLLGSPNFHNHHFYEEEGSTYPGLGTDFRVLSLMQYTNLKDKNGREIYEGDILRVFSKSLLIVSYEDGAFRVGFVRAVIDQQVAGKSEIIGNIYEHPQLLNDIDDINRDRAS